MTEVPSWHAPGFPEYRAAPPWVMEDMIAREPELAADIDRLEGEIGPLVEAARRALDAGQPLIAIGCGTAWHAAEGFADVLGEMLGSSHLAAARQSFDAALDPRAGGLCVAISDSGRTKATLAALEGAHDSSATTALVTANPGSSVGDFAEIVVETMASDDSWCHTLAYLGPIVVGAALGAALTGQRIDASALRALIETAVATEDRAREVARSLFGVARILTVGSGADAVAARELSLKIEEGTYIPVSTHQSENVLHGHLVPCDEMTGMVAVITDRRGREERADTAGRVLRSARSVDVRTAAIVTPEVDAMLDPELTSAGRVVVDGADSLPASLASYTASAAAFQYIAVGIAACADVNPDFCRQDSPRYRRAFELGNAKFPGNVAEEPA